MKTNIFIFTTLLFLAGSAISRTKLPQGIHGSLPNKRIVFTENKGQVHDQFHKSNSDVLFGAMAGDMSVHIKRSGVSYQLFRTDKFVNTGAGMIARKAGGKDEQLDVAVQTVYRTDISWVDYNLDFTTVTDEALRGYDNYYTESCPNGALNIKTYKGVTLNNLYDGINLHYYEKNGSLKYDYIVAPRGEYRKIKLKISGAEIALQQDGSLLLTTPLGTIQEGAPIVYQGGKRLTAKWLISNNVLSFDIEHVNPELEMVIDPITRIWGTYYGGLGTNTVGERAHWCAVDVNGNAYITGFTATGTGTIIATTGAHQTIYQGGYDAFLAKFNGSGTRLWGTYYGGTGAELGYGCATDASGNVFLAGQTSSSLSGVMATTGSHQSTFAGGSSDAFLVKFNDSGVRQWATYYGSTTDDYGQTCSADAAGNVYLGGLSNSTSGLATTSAHQTSSGGGAWDGYVVKFSSAGTRQWGTYYGAAGDDRVFTCAADPSGDIYISGWSTSTINIATLGAHQTVNGGSSDAMLVKFNSNGTRLWGTYYGGAGGESGYCATDLSGKLIMTGSTGSLSTSGTVIATGGAHQVAYGGGPSDGYVVKFNGNGVRQWGTFYGGTADDPGTSCATDAAGNVYIGGLSLTVGSTAIATPGSHQTTNGGGTWDCYFVKFDVNGARQHGSYYGGSGDEYGAWVASTGTGEIYLAGYTTSSSGTVIATSNGHQPIYGGIQFDCFLAKFDACDNAPPQPSAITATTTCAGVTNIFGTSLAAGAHSYTWTLPIGWAGSGSSNTIAATPGASGVFTVIAGNLCGTSPQRTMQVTVNPNPTVTVNSGSICAGGSFTVVPGGAISYTYSSGPVVTPAVTSTYSVTGVNSLGCTDTTVSTVTVHQLPVVTANNGNICIGASFTIVAGGAATYTYSGGPVVSPATNTSIIVSGTSAQGCTNSAVASITVNALPAVSVTSSHTILCAGEQTTLTAQGALNYTFNPGGNGANIMDAPGVTTTYTVTGSTAFNCKNTVTITQVVDACVGIIESLFDKSMIRIYPNPTVGNVIIESASCFEISVVNAMGEVVSTGTVTPGIQEIGLHHLPEGVYLVVARQAENYRVYKVIKQ